MKLLLEGKVGLLLAIEGIACEIQETIHNIIRVNISNCGESSTAGLGLLTLTLS